MSSQSATRDVLDIRTVFPRVSEILLMDRVTSGAGELVLGQ
jgi:hypothetical protein